HRGRKKSRISNYKKKHIGILDSITYKSLTDEEKRTIAFPGDEWVNQVFDIFNANDFIKETIIQDNPLIAAASGCTACIAVAAHILRCDNDMRHYLTRATIAYLVGGGYHSAEEVLKVMYRNSDFVTMTGLQSTDNIWSLTKFGYRKQCRIISKSEKNNSNNERVIMNDYKAIMAMI
ncbi:hypothetical protein NLN82_26965, partial [Citrobacter portucalensis]|uniref:hypothetical protein n=1 Tax=Citrobacter portucalensis TaxID=1639133 RepID=UPI00226B8BAC